MSLDKVKNVGSPIYSQNLIIDDDQSEGEFEKTNHIFILNSKINELNIVIQKMSLQYQQEFTEQKNIIESIKREYQSRSEALGQEYQKVQTIAEAEKQAKNIIAKQLKSTKQVLQQLKMILEMPKEASDQQLKQHLVNINDRNKQLQAHNCQLENQTESIGIMHQEEQEKLIGQFEARAKRQNERHQAKINQLQTEKHKHLLQITTYVKTIEEQKKKIQMLIAIEGDYRKSLRVVEQLQSSQTKLKAELNSLKVKEQIFTITKEKYQQTKLTMDEYVEQMTFKIGLQQKKLEIETARLYEERTRNKNLDSMFCTSKQQLRLAEEKIASLQQNLQELKQKNSMLEIYRQKQKTSVNIINEMEEKNRKLGGEIQRLKQERDEKKNQYNKIQQEKTILEKNINKQCIEIEQLRKDNLQLNLKTKHQGELIDQMKQQINKNKQQLSEAKLQLQQAKLQFQQVLKEQQVRKETSCESNPTLKQVIGYPQREMWQQINQNIVKHYQQLLIEEDRTRLELQQQLQSSRTNINQLKQRLAQTSRELKELQQERQLLIKQNKRLLDSIGAISKSHQQRVTDFRQKFTQLLPVSPHKHTLRHFKSQKHLSISNCYNFTQHTQINQNNDSHTPELKIDRSESSSVENGFKKLVKYSSTDNFTEKYSRQGVQGRSKELSESIRVLRDRNSNMRMRLNI